MLIENTNTRQRWMSICAIVLIATLLTACGAPAAAPTATPMPPTSVPPTDTPVPLVSPSPAPPPADAAWPTAGWHASTPEEQGMDSEKLAMLLETIQTEEFAIDSVMVVRNGHVVLDAYQHPFAANMRHIIHSDTKSIVSALIGIAIEQGYLEGVSQPVLGIFPDHDFQNVDARKEAMTLEDVLVMGTGLDCRDSYLYRWQGMREMTPTRDWVQHVLSLPMAHEPGTHFEYCNGASFLLSAIIQQATGLKTETFADTNLFGPLGISDYDWPENERDINIGWGELQLLPHDMAKIGYLFLNEGEWDGEQIVPKNWVNESTSKHIEADTLQEGYGYQWWVAEEGEYMALGYGGQYIIVAPEYDLVAVFTSALPDQQFFKPDFLYRTFIESAVLSDEPLPPNPTGGEMLTNLTAALAQPAAQPAQSPPEIGQEVSGQTYTLVSCKFPS